MDSAQMTAAARRSGRASWWTRLAATAVILLLATVGVQVLIGNQSSRDKSAAIVNASNAVLADLLNAETGQRGFLLTSDQSFLDPYRQATQDLPADLRRLTDAADKDNSRGQAVDVLTLRDLALDRMQKLATTLSMARAGDRPGALRIVSSGEGKRVMDAARRQVARSQTQAEIAAQAQRSTSRRLAAATLFAAAMMALLFLFLQGRASRWRRASSAQEENFGRVFDEAPIGMALWAESGVRAGVFFQANRELVRITGYSREALLEMTVESLAYPLGVEVTSEIGRSGKETLPAGVATERRWLHADGSDLWVSFSASALTQPSGRRYRIAQIIDITARKHAEEQLTRQALHDPLTDLPNRLLMQDHLIQALNRARRNETGVGVLYVDLDDFKNINDLFGHAVGDAVLVEAAQRLRSCLRESDTAARFGGDEFVIVCEDVTGEPDIEALSRRVTAALSQPLVVEDHPIRLGASTGAVLGYGGAKPDDLIRQADDAMYEAKRGGKARHALADVEMVARAHRHLAIDQELRLALDRDELRLHYQPVVDLRTHEVVSTEALLRWQHPERGLLLPADFLDVAEERSLIVPIGEWVLRTACAQAAAWRASWGQYAPTVAINVAGRQLATHNFADHVRSALTDSGLPPEQLILEITERQILTVANSAQADLERLSEAEVQLSIDDFGTGYSTFDYLRRFHFDILKIDRRFISGLGADPTDSAIVRALLALSDSLHLTVIAEGVETMGQLNELEGLGCTFVQGFHLYRPAEGSAIGDVLQAVALSPH